MRELATARQLYTKTLGFALEFEERLDAHQVSVCFVNCGNTRLEQLAPLSQDIPLARFLTKRGEGLHHLCYQVADLRQSLAAARRLGLELIDSEPRPSACGCSFAFLAPNLLGGVLTELCQEGEP